MPRTGKDADVINRLWQEWDDCRCSGDRDAQETAATALWGKVLQIFGKNSLEMNALGEFWLNDMNKYDPDQLPFYQFLKNRLFYRGKDVQNKDMLGTHEVYEDALTREKKSWKKPLDSLSKPVVNDDTETQATLGDFQESISAENSFLGVEEDEKAYEWLSLILTLPQKLGKKANNPVRINYFRMFFTDNVTAYVSSQQSPDSYIRHERDLFDAMKLPFLDFFMASKCRSISEIVTSRPKPYGEMVPGRAMKEAVQPLANDIYFTYLRRVEQYNASAPAISQQRTAYIQFLREYLC